MAVPPRARAGQRVSASFLNYCRDGVLQYQTGMGIQERGKHIPAEVNPGYCFFECVAEVDIPEFSVFAVKHPPAADVIVDPFLIAYQVTQAADIMIYTNGGMAKAAGEPFYPMYINQWMIYPLQTYMTDPPVQGDLCKPKESYWEVEKGGNQLYCVLAPDPTTGVGYYLGLPPKGGSEQRLAFVINNDILARSTGEVELIGKDDVKNGTVVTVYNPHDVTFYKENVTLGEEHPADRILVLEVLYWDEPVIFPFMLSECQELDPLYSSEDI